LISQPAVSQGVIVSWKASWGLERWSDRMQSRKSRIVKKVQLTAVVALYLIMLAYFCVWEKADRG